MGARLDVAVDCACHQYVWHRRRIAAGRAHASDHIEVGRAIIARRCDVHVCCASYKLAWVRMGWCAFSWLLELSLFPFLFLFLSYPSLPSLFLSLSLSLSLPPGLVLAVDMSCHAHTHLLSHIFNLSC